MSSPANKSFSNRDIRAWQETVRAAYPEPEPEPVDEQGAEQEEQEDEQETQPDEQPVAAS